MDRAALSLELERLHRTAANLQRDHDRLVERVAAFPNTPSAERERELAQELAAVNERRRKIEAELRPRTR
jgi:hypothetical protein